MGKGTKNNTSGSNLPAVTIPETVIQRHILVFLKTQGIFCWRNKSEGTYDPTKRVFRKMTGYGQMRGTADILGIYRGTPLAIEVKSRTGVVSQFQKEFLTQFQLSGGISIIARSVDDVKWGLEQWAKAKEKHDTASL